jgi:hypothetical protein
MGLFGGGSSKSGSAQKWAKPFAIAGANEVRGVYDANKGNLASITKGVTDLLPGISGNYQSWKPLTTQSQGYYGDVLSGKYLDPSNNPGLAGLLARTRNDITDQVNGQFSMAGRYGSGAHTGILTDRLADAENGILYDAYNRERGIQDNAAAMPAQMENQNLAQLLQASGLGAELPYTGVNSLASSLAALFSGGVTKGPGIGGQILSGAAQGASAALAASDRRLKSNIEKVGELDDGLGVYEYDIFGERTRGVMADEVERLRPWALGPVIEGFQTVDYGVL